MVVKYCCRNIFLFVIFFCSLIFIFNNLFFNNLYCMELDFKKGNCLEDKFNKFIVEKMYRNRFGIRENEKHELAEKGLSLIQIAIILADIRQRGLEILGENVGIEKNDKNIDNKVKLSVSLGRNKKIIEKGVGQRSAAVKFVEIMGRSSYKDTDLYKRLTEVKSSGLSVDKCLKLQDNSNKIAMILSVDRYRKTITHELCVQYEVSEKKILERLVEESKDKVENFSDKKVPENKIGNKIDEKSDKKVDNKLDDSKFAKLNDFKLSDLRNIKPGNNAKPEN